jgi:hypothetical protein
MARWPGVLFAIAALALLAPPGASADPDELMPCKLVIIKAAPAAGGNGLTKFLCKGTFALPSAGAAPTGFSLSFGVNTVPPGSGNFGGISCVGLGNPPGDKGYRCSAMPDVPVFLVKTNIVKGIFKFDGPANLGTPHPYTNDVAIRLTAFGTSDSKRYCARFPVGSALKNTPSQFKAKNAPAPAACSPSGAFLDGGDAL